MYCFSFFHGLVAKCEHQTTLDKIFKEDTSQEDVFEEFDLLFQSALTGGNVCVFTYGLTGSGKTYTMMGKGGTQEGLAPRAASLILKTAAELTEKGWHFNVQLSLVEIYNEKVQDLLMVPKQAITLPHAKFETIRSKAEFQTMLNAAQKRRTTRPTEGNKVSSRSHLIISIRIKGENNDEQFTSEVNLIDLAGLEPYDLKSTNETQAETVAINKSLYHLKTVLKALKNNTPPNFSGSKITEVLKPTLKGKGKIAMIVNISPQADLVEKTIKTLMFGEEISGLKTN